MNSIFNNGITRTGRVFKMLAMSTLLSVILAGFNGCTKEEITVSEEPGQTKAAHVPIFMLTEGLM
jgi:hypothetical protein